MKYTNNLNLLKPEGSEYFDIEHFNTNVDIIDSSVHDAFIALDKKVDKNGTDSLMTAEEHTKLRGIATGAEVNVQANWAETNTGSDAFIKNKPSLANYVQKSSTSGLLKNDGTIDTSTYLTQHQDISGKVDKVASATNNHLASLDANGNLKDSGKAVSNFIQKSSTVGLMKNNGTVDTTKYISDISGKQDKTLTSPISVDGVSQTTVEGCLGALANSSGGGGGGGIVPSDVVTYSNTEPTTTLLHTIWIQ